METIQLLNTALVKRRERWIDPKFQERLTFFSKSPALESLQKAINHLSEQEKITKDQATVMLVELITELDQIWKDYITMEGIDQLKKQLSGQD